MDRRHLFERYLSVVPNTRNAFYFQQRPTKEPNGDRKVLVCLVYAVIPDNGPLHLARSDGGQLCDTLWHPQRVLVRLYGVLLVSFLRNPDSILCKLCHFTINRLWTCAMSNTLYMPDQGL